jgi:hypothetical protein
MEIKCAHQCSPFCTPKATYTQAGASERAGSAESYQKTDHLVARGQSEASPLELIMIMPKQPSYQFASQMA